MKTIDWGFDLTNFGTASKFKALLKKHGLVKYKRIHRDYDDDIWAYVYSWKRSDGTLEIHTGNNPLTGAYMSPKQRKPEKGYAGYIGIRGEEDKVIALAKDIRKYYPKDESKFDSDYIW